MPATKILKHTRYSVSIIKTIVTFSIKVEVEVEVWFYIRQSLKDLLVPSISGGTLVSILFWRIFILIEIAKKKTPGMKLLCPTQDMCVKRRVLDDPKKLRCY